MTDLIRRNMMMATDVVPIDAIIIAKRSDNEAAIMEVVYAQGWSASPKYMTKSEAERVTTIGEAFKGNTIITDLTCLKYFTSVTTFGWVSCFDGCTSLLYIELPPNLLNIYNSGFFRGALIQNLTLPKSVNNVRFDYVFNGSVVETISVEEENTTYYSYDGVVYLHSDKSVHYAPPALKGDIEVKAGTKIISANALGKHTITSIYIPDGVESIGSSAFRMSFWGITTPQGTLRIPLSVTSLGETFARGSGFTKVEYYSSVTIPESAFLAAELLKTFVIYNTEKVVDLELVPYGNNGNINYITNHPFRDVSLDAIYVPDELYEDYINSEAWKKGFNLTPLMKKLSEYTE